MLKELFMVKRLQKYNFYLECANIDKKNVIFVNNYFKTTQVLPARQGELVLSKLSIN